MDRERRPVRDYKSYRAALTPNRVRFTALFFPVSGVSNQHWRRYWLNEHGRLFMSLDIVKKNLTKYEQFHFDTELSQSLATAMGASSGGSAFWGMATFEAESWDKILEVFSHPEYARVVLPDEQHVLDRSRTQVFAGEFATILEKSARSKL